MHDPHEILARQLFDRGTRANDRGVVQHPVEMAEFFFDHRRQLVVLMGQGGFQVERDHHRLRMAGGFDCIVDLGQVGFGLAQQQHGGTVGGIGLGRRCTNPATGTGDQDDPVLEQFWACGVIKHNRPQQKFSLNVGAGLLAIAQCQPINL